MNAVKKFIVAMLVVLGRGIVFFIGYFVKSNANLKQDARNNTECKTNERVFDYADKLSDSEEETLRGEIKWVWTLLSLPWISTQICQNMMPMQFHMT